MRIALLFSMLICANVFAAEQAAHHDKKFVAATPVETIEAGAVYGARLPTPMPVAIDLDSAAAHVEDHAGKPAAFSGRITEGKMARVNMHDHAFGVPKNTSGPAIVYGTISKKTPSADEIEHLKKEGASAPQSAELQIDAVSVIIPDAT